MAFLNHLRESMEPGSLAGRPPPVQHILNYKACHSAIRQVHHQINVLYEEAKGSVVFHPQGRPLDFYSSKGGRSPGHWIGQGLVYP